MATKKKPPAPTADALDLLAAKLAADPKQALIMALWLNRHRNPEMSIQIREADAKALNDCVTYLDVQPDVMVFRRPAIPPHEAVPASPGKMAINAFPGAPAAEFVTVSVVAKGTNDGIRPIENNEADAQAGERQAELRRLRETTPQLAAQVKNMAAAQTFSQEMVYELCEAAMLLATAK